MLQNKNRHEYTPQITALNCNYFLLKDKDKISPAKERYFLHGFITLYIQLFDII